MLRLFIFSFVGMIMLSSPGSAASWWQSLIPGSDEPPTITVLSNGDFIPDTTGAEQNTRNGLPDVLAERIIERLTKSKRFIVTERQALRRIIMEQRFEQQNNEGYLSRTLDKAISDMDSLESAGVLGVTAVASTFNDRIQDFQDLGRAMKADYLLIGNLEKMARGLKIQTVPYSTKGLSSVQSTVNARLRLRIINTETGTVVGATSTHVKISENLYKGQERDTDAYSAYDQIARIAAAKVLDAIYPATVAEVDPFVITRGGNEGVQFGDTFKIKRPGKMITDSSGIELGQILSDVGTVKVSQLQDAISIVKVIAGQHPVKGDVAVYEGPEEMALAAQQATSVAQAVNNVDTSLARPRIAVGLIKVGTTASRFEEANFTNFTDTLISRLNQTKRFQVVDRQEVDQLTLEALSTNSGLSSAVGSLSAADYLVLGNISTLNVKEDIIAMETNQNSLAVKDVSGAAQGNIRIVNARTGDILVSKNVEVQVSLDEATADDELITTLSDAYSIKVVSELMQALFPIKVAAVGGDGTIYVNRGNDGGLTVGETLKAYRSGQKVIDPDTGILLGVEEAFIGDVIISNVSEARAKGTLVSNSALQIGDILERAAKATEDNARQTDSPRSGGQIGSTTSVGNSTTNTKGGAYTLAIGTITIDSGLRSGIDPHRLSYRLTDNLVSGLVQSKRFKIMDRKSVDQIVGEKTFETMSNGGSMKARLRQLEGSDYLILGDVTDFKVRETIEEIPYVDAVEITRKGYGEGSLRIVDVHTGAVVASEQIIVKPTIVDEISGEAPEGRNKNLTFLIAKFSDAIVQKIVNGLFPIKVIGVSADDHVFINRGVDGQIKTGQIYNIMRPGEQMIDEDTGILFGSMESKIAEIKIVSVDRARAKGIILNGDYPIKGDIVRGSKLSKQATTDNGAEQNQVKITEPNW